MIQLIWTVLFSFSVWSNVNLGLQFHSNQLKQGELYEATLTLDSASAQSLQNLKISGQTLDETLYIHEVSPLMRKEGKDSYYADAKVIFVKATTAGSLKTQLNGQPIVVKWSELFIAPTEIPQKLIFGKFSIPSAPKLIMILGILFLIIIIVLVVLRFKKRLSTKSQKKAFMIGLKQEVLAANNYADVVKVWQKKRTYCDAFPHLENAFEKLEITLFKYQFKPNQSEAEKEATMKAYREFVSSVREGFNGI